MFFKKSKPSKTASNARRVRQPVAGGGLGAKPVFSYNARNPRSSQADSRRSIKLPWEIGAPAPKQTANKNKASRTKPSSWRKRIIVALSAVALVVLAVNAVVLGREPSINVVAENQGRQILARADQVYAEAAKKAFSASWTSSSKITADTEQIAQEIKLQFPELEAVSITLPLIGSQPSVYLHPAQPALLLASADGGLFVLDTSGRAVAKAANIQGLDKLNLPVVQDQTGLPIEVGRTALPRGNIAFIKEVAGQLKAQDVSVAGIILGANQLDVRLEGAPYLVKFNLRGNARAEAGAFLAAKQHLEQEGKTPAEYIDVRVDNKAYYR